MVHTPFLRFFLMDMLIFCILDETTTCSDSTWPSLVLKDFSVHRLVQTVLEGEEDLTSSDTCLI